METKIKINEIPLSSTYQGYLWWSDEDKPCVYKDELLTDLPAGPANPFIIEGNLWDKVNQKSYSIRFVDGEYRVNAFDLNALDGNECIQKEYLPNRLEKIKKLCFKEFWLPEKDELCEGMEVLKPAMTVFTGFQYKED